MVVVVELVPEAGKPFVRVRHRAVRTVHMDPVGSTFVGMGIVVVVGTVGRTGVDSRVAASEVACTHPVAGKCAEAEMCTLGLGG